MQTTIWRGWPSTSVCSIEPAIETRIKIYLLLKESLYTRKPKTLPPNSSVTGEMLELSIKRKTPIKPFDIYQCNSYYEIKAGLKMSSKPAGVMSTQSKESTKGEKSNSAENNLSDPPGTF
jgi:hypothetical protein